MPDTEKLFRRDDLLPAMRKLLGPSLSAIYATKAAFWCEDQNGLSFDSLGVVLEFKGGARAEVWNSEWGGICFVRPEVKLITDVAAEDKPDAIR